MICIFVYICRRIWTKLSTTLKCQLRCVNTFASLSKTFWYLISFQANPARLVLYKRIKSRSCCELSSQGIWGVKCVFVWLTLQSSLIQEVVQVKQGVSRGQVLDETLWGKKRQKTKVLRSDPSKCSIKSVSVDKYFILFIGCTCLLSDFPVCNLCWRM